MSELVRKSGRSMSSGRVGQKLLRIDRETESSRVKTDNHDEQCV